MKQKSIFQAVFDAAPDAIVVVNNLGSIIMSNKQATELFGYKKDELTGKPVELLMPKQISKEHIRHRANYLHKPEVREMGARQDLLAQRKDGSEFSVEISLSPINIEGEVLVVASVRDVSEKKKINHQLKQSLAIVQSKNKELEQFAYIASHDLQEPLRTVKSFTELLSEDYTDKLDDTGKKFVSTITDATSRMSDLIKGLLDYSRIGTKREISLVDCNKVLADIKADLAATITEAEAKISVDSELPSVWSNPSELRMLFQNLLSNALKFHKAGIAPEINITAKRFDSFYQFAIQDNGIGIDDKHKDKIFIIFQRLHNRKEFQGTGIGLAHCRKIVEIHGGRIWCDSKIGEGSTFYFTLLNMPPNEYREA